MDLIDELKALRERKGVSQATVADALGCDQGAISHWENKKAKPSGSARILLQGFMARMREMPDKADAA